jgi:hypothetical protein
LKEKHGLKVFENGVLRRIFGPKKDEVTEEWRRLHNADLYAVYSSPNFRVIKAKRMRLARHVLRVWEERNSYRVMVVKPEGRR